MRELKSMTYAPVKAPRGKRQLNRLHMDSFSLWRPKAHLGKRIFTVSW